MSNLRVIDIIPGTSVDGPGLRTSIYFAGCTHKCPGCHNPQSWDPEAGREMSVDEILQVVEYNGFDVTFSGGDPLFQADRIIPLAEELRKRGYSIWCYTGYLYEQAMQRPGMADLLGLCDVLVDGPYMESLRDVHLQFRGSANQRLIDLKRSSVDEIVEWKQELSGW